MVVNNYGPVSYLIHGLVFSIFGGSIALTKVATAIASVLFVAVFSLHAHRRYGLVSASSGILMLIGGILVFAPSTFLNRPDALTVLLVAVALMAPRAMEECSSGGQAQLSAVILIGVCVGLAVNLKVHSFIYFGPVVLDRLGWLNVRAMAGVAAVSIAVFLLPFSLPGLSLVDFINGLFIQVPGREIDDGLLSKALKY